MGRGGMKNEKHKESNNVTTTIKFFIFVFCIWKRIYFARKHSLKIKFTL